MRILSFILLLFLISCAEKTLEHHGSHRLQGLPSIEGTQQYLGSPFVTAGDRVYMVGHQDGTFPDIGWHIPGEMGGIWDHPVKLMDGFAASIVAKRSGEIFCLNQADKFVNYPVGNAHHYSWNKEKVSIERFQFVPDGLEGLILEFTIRNHGDEEKEFVFSFTALTDLRPTWLGERSNMQDGKDTIYFDDKLETFTARDNKNPWFTIFGSSRPANASDADSCVPETSGSGARATLAFPVKLGPHAEEVIPVFIAGSYESENAARETFESLRQGDTLLAQKIARYDKIRAASMLTIPDEGIGQMYEWLKYNTDWLVRHVPGQGVGVSAGLPDYPWWFGADMTYTLQGVLATGDHDLARNSIMLLADLSAKTNRNGRIIHEASTNGAVYNPGNVNETAQFISLLRTYYAWTADKALISELFPQVRKGIKWLLQDMDPDHNGYPNGSGMMEIPGLDTEMIDVAVYTQQGLEAAAELARALGDANASADYSKKAQDLKTRINQEWWNEEEKSFGDFRGTVADAGPILKAALIRADTLRKPWAVEELKATEQKLAVYPRGRKIPHVIYHNWVVNTPMETGIADFSKGQQAIKTARKYENPFGVFVTGIDRTGEPDSVVLKSRKKTFSYTGAVMTLPTGVQAVANARYGTPDEALEYLRKLERSFSYALPGSMYEVSPDFGMVTQAWNIYGVAVPIINYFFGIQPSAGEQTVHLAPRMPSSWKNAALADIKVGNNALNFEIANKGDHTVYRISQTLPDWTIVIDLGEAAKVVVNGRELLQKGSIKVNGREIEILVYP